MHDGSTRLVRVVHGTWTTASCAASIASTVACTGSSAESVAAFASTVPAARAASRAATLPALAEEMPSHTTTATLRSSNASRWKASSLRRCTCPWSLTAAASTRSARPERHQLTGSSSSRVPHCSQNRSPACCAAPQEGQVKRVCMFMSTSWVELIGTIDELDALGAARRPARQLAVGALHAEAQVTFQQPVSEQAGLLVAEGRSALHQRERGLEQLGLQARPLPAPDRERGEDRAGGEQLVGGEVAAGSVAGGAVAAAVGGVRVGDQAVDPGGLGLEVGARGIGHPVIGGQRTGAVARLQAAAGESKRRRREGRVRP